MPLPRQPQLGRTPVVGTSQTALSTLRTVPLLNGFFHVKPKLNCKDKPVPESFLLFKVKSDLSY